MPEDLEVPTAPAGFQQRPGLTVGVIFSLLLGFYTLIGAGGLDDGWQWADLGVILGPLMTGVIIDRLTFSQNQADDLAPRSVQRKVVERR